MWKIHEKKGVTAMTENVKTRKLLKDIATIDTFNEIINAAMLTDEDRFILTEHYLKGKNFAYIADELGYAEITINKRHCKILQKLSRILR